MWLGLNTCLWESSSLLVMTQVNARFHLAMLRWFCGSTLFIDMVGLDLLKAQYLEWFAVIYILKNIGHVFNTLLLFVLSDRGLLFGSIATFWWGSIWAEWEIYDFFGILFLGHPDMWRLLTDYAFWGFPLWKDFPLVGFVEINYYDTKLKSMVLQEIELGQMFWLYDF